MFDFDNSQKEWRKNKVYLGNGSFKYKCNRCSAYTKNNKLCKNMTRNEFCHIHSK